MCYQDISRSAVLRERAGDLPAVAIVSPKW
jgi:hypothetical protein